MDALDRFFQEQKSFLRRCSDEDAVLDRIAEYRSDIRRVKKQGLVEALVRLHDLIELGEARLVELKKDALGAPSGVVLGEGRGRSGAEVVRSVLPVRSSALAGASSGGKPPVRVVSVGGQHPRSAMSVGGASPVDVRPATPPVVTAPARVAAPVVAPFPKPSQAPPKPPQVPVRLPVPASARLASPAVAPSPKPLLPPSKPSAPTSPARAVPAVTSLPKPPVPASMARTAPPEPGPPSKPQPSATAVSPAPAHSEPPAPEPVSSVSSVYTGADLARYREAAGLTQRQLAERLAVAHGTVAKAELEPRRALKPLLQSGLAGLLGRVG